ncbi:MAG: hypothetical protein NXI31_10120 [bacterium]|nr:hypothetical protein [bacterium]
MTIRLAVAALLVLLAGCAASPEARWHQIQAQRLEKLHGDRDFDDAMTDLRARFGADSSAPVVEEPAVLPQDPARGSQKIDQREPVGPDGGPRRFYGARDEVRVRAAVGHGSVKVRVPGTNLTDRTSATFVRLGFDGRADAAIGPGFDVEAYSSDDDLFAGRQMNNGAAPALASARAAGYRLYPHLRAIVDHGGELAFPVRLGVAVNYTDLEHDLARVDRDWLTVGPRFEAEPRLTLLGDARHGGRLDLFGRFGAELGYGAFREDYVGGDDHGSMSQWGYSAAVGLRWGMPKFTLDLGYEFAETRFGNASTDLFVNPRGTRLAHQRVWLGGSARF